MVGWSGGRGLAVLAGGLLRVRAVVVGGGSAGAMWKTDSEKKVVPLLLFLFVTFLLCYLLQLFIFVHL